MKDYDNVDSYERRHGLRWDDLVGLEPELFRLLEAARLAGRYCRRLDDVNRKFSAFKDSVAEYAGYLGRHSRHPILGSQAAYDVVYWKLRNAVAGHHKVADDESLM